MICAQNLFYRVDDTPILNDISVTIERGTITAILGPNGAGKSTLLKCLAGLYLPTEGHVTFDGKVLSQIPITDLAKQRAVLSQSTTIAFPFTVLDIVMMGRNLYREIELQSTSRAIALEALTLLEADRLKYRIFSSLSGGEQQLVQIARVLAQIWQQDGAYLFLDEPTSALDLKYQFLLIEILKHHAIIYKFSIVIILHDLKFSRLLADRSIFMKTGHITAIGNSDELITKETINTAYDTNSTYVATYLGL